MKYLCLYKCELAYCAFGFNHFLWPWQARLYAPLFRSVLSVNLAIAKANAQVDNRSPAQSGVSTAMTVAVNELRG